MDLLLKENLLRDVEDLVTQMDDEFTDQDVTENTYGVDLMVAAVHYAETYNGKSDFMGSMKAKLLAFGKLTPAQARAVLNILRQEKLGIAPVQPERDRAVKCFTCGENYPNMNDLLDHKERDHNGRKPMVLEPETGEMIEEKRVIANTTSALKLDLSSLPDGRYAAPDLTGEKSFIFIMVRRQRKRVYRNRRYIYGKVLTGSEWVEAGTIEVKEWSSDSKRLCGEQRPGGLYEGEFELQLRAIMAGPEPWSRLFGQQIGHCGICGKTLTDDISRSDGFGPECIKKIDTNKGYFTTPVPKLFERNFDPIRKMERVWCLEHLRFDCDEKHTFFDVDDVVD